MDEYIFYQWFAIGWICLAAIICFALFFITAPYGKFTRPGWGPMINRAVGWMIMESPAVWMMVLLFVLGDQYANPVSIAFLVLWEIHYLQRSYVFPLRMRGDKKRITLTTVLLGMVFNMGNGYLNGYCLFFRVEQYPLSWFTDLRFLIGFVLFFVGLSINIHSDGVLRSLREPGETGYRIPLKGMFRYVSSANYFGEIVEWIGWAVLTWSSAGLVFFVWTAANLVPRAWSQHTWYRATFSDYPKERKAVIPFVF